jgi:8-oxo-dGTP pyrophosphatase MutT (NUDIX family)
MKDASNEPSVAFSDAAVLVPVYRRPDSEVGMVLIRRVPHGPHGNQIAFRGGRREPEDKSLQVTALREAVEEIGIESTSTEILAELPRVETLTTGARITPFLARIIIPRTWRLQKTEIAEIIEIRVSDFGEPGAKGTTVKRMPAWQAPRHVPFLRVGALQIWGATFRILDPLIPRLLSNEWSI